MISLQDKKRNNIVEYIYFLWHVEDLLRSVNFEMNVLEDKFFVNYEEGKAKIELKVWYQDYARQMKAEHVTQTGHTSIVYEALNEIYYLHNSLVNIFQDKTYIDLYEKVLPHVEKLREKSKNKKAHFLELCLNGVYGVVMLKLKNKSISPETADSVALFTELLNYISARYSDIQSGKELFPNKINN